jgi:hypothetical protein
LNFSLWNNHRDITLGLCSGVMFPSLIGDKTDGLSKFITSASIDFRTDSFRFGDSKALRRDV